MDLLVNAMFAGGVRVLLADDDPIVSDVVRRYLERDGLQVTLVGAGDAALEHLENHQVDLVILDVMMPGRGGIEVLTEIRRGPRAGMPVILLTASGEEEDRLVGLEAGADDYVIKPFSPRELVLRVQSVLRRSVATWSGPAAASDLSDGNIVMDAEARTVTVAGELINTTKREFDLLRFFLSHRDAVFSREQLLSLVWGWSFGDLSTVTVHVKRLRAKLGDCDSLETVWGQGYRWGSEPASRQETT
ncbi:winged helix family two component transcriptional regulator [Williamsia muralis]|uniref:Winged helix family two component transcriptional regulator n=2 Tax=Williamsia marianensis TaxID=85044 RepID=A0A495K411_WILMA|nr:winged helix family two component transcriptional regulator [Williamsia muralis]